MTTVEANAARIFEDAHRLADAAQECMEAGEVRDAAEKAWCATLRAAEALVLARTGQGPGTSSAATRRLQALVLADPALDGLLSRYFSRQRVLHGGCFYHDNYEPDMVESLILRTAEYVREAERSAQR